jgi:hypothetical protein
MPDTLPSNLAVCLDDKCSPTTLAAILGYTAPLLYQEAARGVIPVNFQDYTYKEIIHNYVKYFKKAQDVKLAKEANEQELRKAKRGGVGSFVKPDGSDSSLEVAELTIAKMKSDVRLNVAREAQVWLKTYVERKQYVSLVELTELAEPFILTIKNLLLSLAHANPLFEEQIDQTLESLHNLGKTIVSNAEYDGDNFLDTIMEKEIDYSKLELEYKGSSIL